MRLIDADAILEKKFEAYDCEDPIEVVEVSDIEDAPTVEVEPVRHGHWIQVDNTKCKCSVCDVICYIALYPHGAKNYCPNCGAKMDLGI